MKDTFNSIRKYEKYEVNKDGVVRNASTQQQLFHNESVILNITKINNYDEK